METSAGGENFTGTLETLDVTQWRRLSLEVLNVEDEFALSFGSAREDADIDAASSSVHCAFVLLRCATLLLLLF